MVSPDIENIADKCIRIGIRVLKVGFLNMMRREVVVVEM